MGNRISISFYKKDDYEKESIVIFSHWGGYAFVNQAIDYLTELKAENKEGNMMMPLDRLEPDTVIIDFIRWLTKDEIRVKSDLYLGKDTHPHRTTCTHNTHTPCTYTHLTHHTLITHHSHTHLHSHLTFHTQPVTAIHHTHTPIQGGDT